MTTSDKVYTRQVLELEFTAQTHSDKPYTELEFDVLFTSPQGNTYQVPGFWAGGQRWKARLAPREAGRWHWRTRSEDSGLNSREGSFEALPYAGEHPMYNRGFLCVHESGRGFAHEDGTPFFWLGDTVWSAAAHAEFEEWKEYLAHRSRQGYNVVQINSLPQWDASGVPLRKPFEETEEGEYDLDRPKAEYFNMLDQIVEWAAAAGMMTAMVALWFNHVPMTNLNWDFEVKRPARFNQEQARRYGRFLAARYAAYGTIWLVSGDTDIEQASLCIYHAAAEGISEASPYKALMSAHFVGGVHTPESVNELSWLDFHMLQSGHYKGSASGAKKMALKNRALAPVRPVLNGEPAYEFIMMGGPQGVRSDREFVRSVMWASVLGGGNAGITYGSHGLWPWHREGQSYFEPCGEPQTWREGLKQESGEDAARLKRFMSKLPWWKLEPVTAMNDRFDSVASTAAQTPDHSLLLVYAAKADSICLRQSDIKCQDLDAAWFDPASGRTAPARLEQSDQGVLLEPQPWEGDAVLKLASKER